MSNYQPKVSTTQKHSDSQGEHIVCEGKLVLTEEKLSKDQKCKKLLSLYDIDGNKYKLKPIIISETEEIEKGDWYYTHLGNLYRDTGKFMPEEGEEDLPQFTTSKYKKVLALPEHFSDKHLQAIVDGKMKEGKVLLKCFLYGEKLIGGTIGEHPKYKDYKVHLNQQNHITLFHAQQFLEEVASKHANDVYPEARMLTSFGAYKRGFIAGVEWTKKNN